MGETDKADSGERAPHDQRLLTEHLERAFRADATHRTVIAEGVYAELRRIAGQAVGQQLPGNSMHVTNVVHEAYLRMAQGDRRQWKDHQHFLSWAAAIVRSILIDRARAKLAQKRGNGAKPLPLDDQLAAEQRPDLDVLALDEALTRLAEEDPEGARVVQLRYFCGLTRAEVARVLEVDESTVKRRWRKARGRLAEMLGEE